MNADCDTDTDRHSDKDYDRLRRTICRYVYTREAVSYGDEGLNLNF
jgi:hypothetical protein